MFVIQQIAISEQLKCFTAHKIDEIKNAEQVQTISVKRVIDNKCQIEKSIGLPQPLHQLDEWS